jgi:tetratricopeptide (TPR) repeat protein
LGVLLYELLTGTLPLDKKRIKEVMYTLRIIRETEPPKPSTKLASSAELPAIAAKRKLEPAKLTKLLRGDLDWIVMKCLEKERNRRYETASGLAMDVQRYLNDEAVLASPPSLRYRLRKYGRKHRGPLLAVSVIVLLLVAGIIGTSVGLVRSQEKEREAQNERAAALASQKQAMEALRATTDDVMERLIGGKPVLGPAEKAFLETTLKRWQAFADTAGEGEQARAIRAEGVFRVAKLREKLGQREEAVLGYRQAIASRQKLVDDFPRVPQHLQDLALTYAQLGHVFDDLGKEQECETALRQALALREKLAAEFPDEPEYRFDEASSHLDLGDLLVDRRKLAQAESPYQHALALYDQLIAASPAAAKYRLKMIVTRNRLGGLLMLQGNFAAGEEATRQAIGLLEKLVNEFPDNPDYRNMLAWSYRDLGVGLINLQGRFEEAEECGRQALVIWEKLAAEFPAVPDYKYALARVYMGMSTNLTLLRRGLDIAEKLVAEFPTVPEYRRVLGAVQGNIGRTFLDLSKDLEKALPWFDKAVATGEEALRRGESIDRGQSGLQEAHKSRAEALSALQHHAEALKDYDKMVKFAPEPERPYYRSIRAVGRMRAGQVPEAIEEAEEMAKKEGDRTKATLYLGARVYALASVPSKANPISPQQQAKYAERAIALLRQAVAKGYKNVNNMKNDDDLKSLRPRDDFQKLLSEMQK